jgi:hypothetical protein
VNCEQNLTGNFFDTQAFDEDRKFVELFLRVYVHKIKETPMIRRRYERLKIENGPAGLIRLLDAMNKVIPLALWNAENKF